MADSAPVHSKTTSKPSGAEKADRKERVVSRAFLSCSSARAAGVVGCGLVEDDDWEGDEQQPLVGNWECDDDDGVGRQKTSSANPFFFANSSLEGLMSIATTRDAPVCFASAQARRPMAPTPKTRTDWLGAS